MRRLDRLSRSIALASVITVAAPGAAPARPLVDRQPQPLASPDPVTVVREVPAEQTLALVMSGAALLVAVGAGGLTLTRGSRAAGRT